MLGNPHCPISSLAERFLFLFLKNLYSVKYLSYFSPSTICNLVLKVFAVSKKVHTTRSRALGVLTEEDTQIVRTFLLPFCFNPGMLLRSYIPLSINCLFFVDLAWYSWSYYSIKGQKVLFPFRYYSSLSPSGFILLCNTWINSVFKDTSWRSLYLWIPGTRSKKLT